LQGNGAFVFMAFPLHVSAWESNLCWCSLQIVARLTVRAHPRSSRRQLRWDGQTLEAWVTEPAAGNAANRALISAIAEWLNVPRSAVRLVAGHRSRAKVVEVEGLTTLPPAG
jgi:uncharacterized protein